MEKICAPIVAVPLFAMLAACSSTHGHHPDGGVVPDAPAMPDAPAVTCQAPTGAPVVHDTPITADETWSADSLHVVQGVLDVRDGATLTIAPCAVVQLAKDAGLNLGVGTASPGTLLAEGTATEPIRFERQDAASAWSTISLESQGTARLRYVTLEGGGSDAGAEYATLIASGNGTVPVLQSLLVDHVTVTDSVGYGVVLEQEAAFAAGSTDLVISGSGQNAMLGEPYPLKLDQNALGTIPTGVYTGNATDAIDIAPEGVQGSVTGTGIVASETLPARGVPYHVDHGATGSMRIEDGTLTIEPGVTLQFAPAMRFEITHATGTTVSPATLVAVGTAAAPITFTSDAQVPAAGDWDGLWFGEIANGANRLDHVDLDYAGADCLCTLVSCNDVNTFAGAILFTQPPAPGFSITNTAISHSAGHGIVRGWQSDSMPSFAAGNTFTDVAGCVETLPVPASGSCPSPKPACP